MRSLLLGSAWLKAESGLRQIVPAGLKAIVFDVDGTLYRQNLLRRAMAIHLLRDYVFDPLGGLLTFRCLNAYRQAQEIMRVLPRTWPDIAQAQVQLACQRARVSEEKLRACITRWMDREPLDLLSKFVYEGAKQFLKEARDRRLRLAAYSDYPASQKLSAMGLESLFEVVVSAQDPAVQRFKPAPLGLQVTLERLGVDPQEALFVGDRPEVDGVAALRAGVPCVILAARRPLSGKHGQTYLRSYRDLFQVLPR